MILWLENLQSLLSKDGLAAGRTLPMLSSSGMESCSVQTLGAEAEAVCLQVL